MPRCDAREAHPEANEKAKQKDTASRSAATQPGGQQAARKRKARVKAPAQGRANGAQPPSCQTVNIDQRRASISDQPISRDACPAACACDIKEG